MTTSKKKQILMIDDEELLVKTFSILLQKSGHEVYVAKNGDDAIAMTEEEKFDLIICDIRMPGINGVETVKAIRKAAGDNSNREVPVIFITGFADQKTESDANELAPLGYLYKPFDNAELLDLVNAGLKQ
jgi:CheY-like chemotaxis protein